MYNQANNELMHYGVLGMKWGVHRAKKKGTTYKYKSWNTKSYEKRAEAAKRTGRTDAYKKATAKAKKSAEFDKRLQSEAQSMSAGKTTLQVLINGTFGTKSFAAAKASGYSNVGATGMALATNLLAGPAGNMVLTDMLRREYMKG